MAENGKRKDPDSSERAPESKIIGTSSPDMRTTTKAATGTVIVGCKIPNGIVLQLSTFESTQEPVMGGGHRDVKIGRKVGEKYVVKGPSTPFGMVPRYLVAGGYALTSGIPREFWDEWVKQNHDADIVRRQLVIAHSTMEDVERQCLDNEKLLTGLEPIDPNNLPRGIQTAEVK